MKGPNKSNNESRYFSVGILYLFSAYNTFNGFDKNANSTNVLYSGFIFAFILRFVWRQSGFAFFVRRLRLPHF